MNPDLPFLFQSVLFQSVKASALIVLIFGLRLLLAKRLSPVVKHAIWLLVLVALLVSIPSSWSVFNYLPELPLGTVHETKNYQTEESFGPPESINGDLFSGVSSPEVTAPHTSSEYQDRQKTSLMETDAASTDFFASSIIAKIWLLGCGGMILIFFRQWILCRRWLEKAVPLKDEHILVIFEQCVKQFGTRCWILALRSDDVPAPFLISAVRPRLLLPGRFVESASDEDLQNVFLHELAHLKRCDVWTSWLMSFVLIFHWFNPFLWLAIKVMNDDREQACDVMALKRLDRGRRKNYSLLLVALAEQGNALRRIPGLVGLSETGRQLTGRLEAIRRIGSWKPFWAVLACIPVLFLALTAMTDAQNRRGYFSSLFSIGLERFNEFDGKHGATDGYIRELLTDAEDLNHELRIIVRKVQNGDSSSGLIERANEINLELRMLMDEIRSPELRLRRKNLALHRSEVLSSLQEQTVRNLSGERGLNSTTQQLIGETQRLKNRLDRIAKDLRQAEKLNGYTFELIEESEGIHHKLGILLDEIRGPSSRLDRQSTLAVEVKRLLTEYRLWEEMLPESFPENVRKAHNDLLRLAGNLEYFDPDEATSIQLLQEAQASVTVLNNAIKEKRESINSHEMTLSLSKKTTNELQNIFALHP